MYETCSQEHEWCIFVSGITVRQTATWVLIENASAPAGTIGLPSEGSQLFKVNGKYYLFNIAWPKGGMRTVVVHRADKLTGPWEGKVAFQDKGVAQGGLIDTPDGKWFSYLFRDYDAVGRIPYLVPASIVTFGPIIQYGPICTSDAISADASIIAVG